MSKTYEWLCNVVIGGCLIYTIALLGFFTYQAVTKGPTEDKASDVMKSCVDTGMYLHKGYAITCRVLVDGSFDPKEVKL